MSLKTTINNAFNLLNDKFEDKTIQIIDNNLFYNGYVYYKYEKYIQKKFRKNNFRCKNRKDERFRKKTDPFCNAQFIIEVIQNDKFENTFNYSLIEAHSSFCTRIKTKSVNEINKIIFTWEDYKKKCIEKLDEYDVINRSTALEKCLKLYNSKLIILLMIKKN